jgi:hypothetical protein
MKTEQCILCKQAVEIDKNITTEYIGMERINTLEELKSIWDKQGHCTSAYHDLNQMLQSARMAQISSQERKDV